MKFIFTITRNVSYINIIIYKSFKQRSLINPRVLVKNTYIKQCGSAFIMVFLKWLEKCLLGLIKCLKPTVATFNLTYLCTLL